MRLLAVNLAVFGAAFLLCLIGVELALRAFGFSFEIAPKRIEFGWPDPVIIENHLAIDEDLFWVRKDYSHFLEQVANRRPQVVFMGDSCTVMGTYPNDFAELVKQRRLKTALRWARFGEGGYSSYQGLQQLQRDVLSLHPKVITFCYGWNDHWLGFGVEDKEIASLKRKNRGGSRTFELDS